MRQYSIIIPVYNRPNEIDELLESLTHQTFKNFEVLVIEDGSKKKCDAIIEKYTDLLNISYYYKENSGQGFSRNFGFQKAKGDYLIVFDSDCLIPPHYLAEVEKVLDKQKFDAFGGPDRAHDSFTPLQKAINYSMTSLFTTGGIRGRKKHVGTFHPRSFNMGISREVFEKTNGYIITRMGEDIEFSIRIINHGFKTGLIENAFVYHKRRTDLPAFFRQLHFFGRARINVKRFFSSELKLVHAFPAVFLIALLGTFLVLPLIHLKLFKIALSIFILYFGSIFLDSSIKNRNLKVGLLSIATSFVQLSAYGLGFLQELGRDLTKRK
ncbi:glycosyltransferase [Fulvivirgaceae bacterium BMA10]|uniref:Glycosyltransferase n=1 Tax=Splendidivirga corallicola TaxID=3051826 RepID=A0ABT8KKT7_9BACT|nr:glycosyltransferase [Fulvivirgaceae bacterium BMA10]